MRCPNRLAYDGRGNAVVRSAAELEGAAARLGGYGHGLYAERWAPFVKARRMLHAVAPLRVLDTLLLGASIGCQVHVAVGGTVRAGSIIMQFCASHRQSPQIS